MSPRHGRSTRLTAHLLALAGLATTGCSGDALLEPLRTEGDVLVVTVTEGPMPDPDGYRIAVAGEITRDPHRLPPSAWQTIGSNDQVLLKNIPYVAELFASTPLRTLWVTGAASNCAFRAPPGPEWPGGPDMKWSVDLLPALGRTAELTLRFVCVERSEAS